MTFETTGVGRSFDAMAHRTNWLVELKEVSRNANQIFVIANVFGGATTAEEDT